MKPIGTRQELVGIFAIPEELHKFRELCRVFRTNVGGLADEVLGVTDSPNHAVHGLATETRIDDDRPNNQSRWLQQHVAAIVHIDHVLY